MPGTVDLSTLVNVSDFEAAARGAMSEAARAYVFSGSANEITMARNRAAFDELRLLPRVLRDVSKIDTSRDLFGRTLAWPLLIAPVGYQRLAHPQGERATAEGARAARVPIILSTVSTTPVERVVESGADVWFQLYTQRNADITRRLVERAEAAGCRALVVTVDTPVLGSRDRERRLVFPAGEETRAVHLEAYEAELGHGHAWVSGSIFSPFLNPGLTWDEIGRIRAMTRLPVLIKGVLAADDARRAVEAGLDGLIVSNHGGRNLDTVPATIEVLEEIAAAVAGRCRVLLDGGVRRGTDILKALALGADAVCVGRPAVSGLAVAGATGVARVLEILELELRTAMALSGVTALDRIDATLIWRGRAMEDAR